MRIIFVSVTQVKIINVWTEPTIKLNFIEYVWKYIKGRFMSVYSAMYFHKKYFYLPILNVIEKCYAHM